MIATCAGTKPAYYFSESVNFWNDTLPQTVHAIILVPCWSNYFIPIFYDILLTVTVMNSTGDLL